MRNCHRAPPLLCADEAPEVDGNDGAYIWFAMGIPEVVGAYIWLMIGTPEVVGNDGALI